jgi:hypothetical protein
LIGGVSFNGSADINLPGVNAAGNQNTTGSAATLTTARTINGVSFNGSANITVTANTPNSVTFNNGGSGAASGSTFNGSGAVTVSFNTVGAPSTTGTNASGTWGIAITGNAGNASSISNAVGGAYTWTAANQFTGNGNTASAFGPGLQVFSTGGNGAVMGFHRGGAFGVNMGLDSDNVFRIGGWSASANRMQMDMSGNLTMSGNVQANSDERLKKDWELLPIDFLDRLAAVKSGTYTRIDSGARQAGVSAQAMREVLTEVVSADAEGTLSVAYGNVALVAAIELAKELITIRQKLAKIIDEE